MGHENLSNTGIIVRHKQFKRITFTQLISHKIHFNIILIFQVVALHESPSEIL
jgi:hypothetical protein